MKIPLRSLGAFLLLIALTACWAYITPKAQKHFKARQASFSVTVYPVNISCIGKGTQGDFRLGQELADWLNAAGIAEARLIRPGAPIKVKWHANQAKMAQESAKSFGSWVREAKITTDYALLAEILCNQSETKVLGVHFYLAEKSGLLADGSLTNSHWDEFKRVNPVDRHGGLAVLKAMLEKRWPSLKQPPTTHGDPVSTADAKM